jgi:hypothetical protein
MIEVSCYEQWYDFICFKIWLDFPGFTVNIDRMIVRDISNMNCYTTILFPMLTESNIVKLKIESMVTIRIWYIHRYEFDSLNCYDTYRWTWLLYLKFNNHMHRNVHHSLMRSSNKIRGCVSFIATARLSHTSDIIQNIFDECTSMFLFVSIIDNHERNSRFLNGVSHLNRKCCFLTVKRRSIDETFFMVSSYFLLSTLKTLIKSLIGWRSLQMNYICQYLCLSNACHRRRETVDHLFSLRSDDVFCMMNRTKIFSIIIIIWILLIWRRDLDRVYESVNDQLCALS